MKEWQMIHEIKSLYSEGKGLSQRQIALKLGISRNSVKKYLSQSVEELVVGKAEASERMKKLDKYQEYILHMLHHYPKLSAVKIMRKLKEKEPEIGVSSRSVRRYVEGLKAISPCKQKRYYQPVLDMVPGVQCQVDPGELGGIRIGGVETRVYFVVFVLSYSRMMYVGLSKKPINTECFIQMHHRAFSYFGGVVEECVYDQTKMVVLEEHYRELTLNEPFYRYATQAGFSIRACEGYDPESKGKVEAGVKFVKYNGLYGEDFASWSELESYVADWLEGCANSRCHGTTGLVPKHVYVQQEQQKMRPYQVALGLHQQESQCTRKADKVGLISWKSSKYSVPLAYQQSTLGVEEQENKLMLYDLVSGELIACHERSLEKGRLVQKSHHYRNLEEQTASLEQKVVEQLGPEQGRVLCQLIKKTAPKIYKDQLRGIIQMLGTLPQVVACELIEKLCQRPLLTASAVKDYFTAYACKASQQPSTQPTAPGLAQSLVAYQQLLIQEQTHVLH
jgi:transposase